MAHPQTRSLGGSVLVLLGLFLLIPFLGMVSIGDTASAAEHFVAMVVTFVLGGIAIGAGARVLESSTVRKAHLGLALAGALLMLIGGVRAANSWHWAERRPDIWAYHIGDFVFWVVYVVFGAFVAYRGLRRGSESEDETAGSSALE